MSTERTAGEFYVVPANGWIDDNGEEQNNSAHVMQRGRWNEFGEPYCVVSYVTWERAQEAAAEMNREGGEGLL